MIISFKNINGGGGGGYVLPTATPTRLGGVMIGDGINVENDGTISVSGGGDSTKLVSVSELPLTANTGDVFSLYNKIENDVYCYVEADGVVRTSSFSYEGTVSIIKGNALPSENLKAIGIEYWGENYIYLTSAGTFILDGGIVDNQPIEIPQSGWTRDEGGYYFNVIPTNEGLDMTFTDVRTVDVYYSVPFETLSQEVYIVKDSGERAALDSWYDSSYGNNNIHIVFLYYGELPQNEILFSAYHTQWDNYLYWSWDGSKLCAWNDEDMLDRNQGCDMYFNTNRFDSSNFYMYNFTEGVLSIASRELQDNWELYGDWYENDEMTYEPIDWQNKVNNIKSFALPLAFAKINNVPFLGAGDVSINGVPDNGSVGQVLTKRDYDYGWEDLVIPRTEIYQAPPFGANEGDLILTNTEYYPYTAATFIARNSTSESDRNNFSDTDEIAWYDFGNNYIYFGNASAYTNTKETFLYKIALRTNENGDWNTSELAYINVLRRNGQYYIFMDNFNYYDTEGTPTPYTFTMYLSQTGNTSGNTPYLPLWKWWDGGYGYKFHFELDQDNNLKMWMRYSDVDRDNQEPDYVQGQNYGDVAYRCMNHTDVFYDYINLDQDDTYLSIYKGGVWYELGYLTRQGV